MINHFVEADTLIYNYLKSKLDNRSCSIFFDPGIRYIIYQGSTDPGTIKSKYIPKIGEIKEFINKALITKEVYKKITFSYNLAPTIVDQEYRKYYIPLEISNELDSDVEYCFVSILVKFDAFFMFQGEHNFEFTVRYLYPEELHNYVTTNR